MRWEKGYKGNKPIGHQGSVFVRWEGGIILSGI